MRLNAQHRANIAGFRPDLGLYMRSNMEANYARYLKQLQKLGAIVSWEYEPELFWFLSIKRGVRSYLPDFRVQHKGEPKPVYIEVKGYMDARSATKIKRFRKYYPQHDLEVVGKSEYAAIRKKWASSIPAWE